jgi:hypothetical protein
MSWIHADHDHRYWISTRTPQHGDDVDKLRPFVGLVNALLICAIFYILAGAVTWYVLG